MRPSLKVSIDREFARMRGETIAPGTIRSFRLAQIAWWQGFQDDFPDLDAPLDNGQAEAFLSDVLDTVAMVADLLASGAELPQFRCASGWRPAEEVHRRFASITARSIWSKTDVLDFAAYHLGTCHHEHGHNTHWDLIDPADACTAWRDAFVVLVRLVYGVRHVRDLEDVIAETDRRLMRMPRHEGAHSHPASPPRFRPGYPTHAVPRRATGAHSSE